MPFFHLLACLLKPLSFCWLISCPCILLASSWHWQLPSSIQEWRWVIYLTQWAAFRDPNFTVSFLTFPFPSSRKIPQWSACLPPFGPAYLRTLYSKAYDLKLTAFCLSFYWMSCSSYLILRVTSSSTSMLLVEPSL